MVSASDVHNLVHYEVAKVVDEVQEVVIFVDHFSHLSHLATIRKQV